MVGPKPSKSTTVSITTAHNGLDVKYQNGRAVSAASKNNQSVRVMDISDRFAAAKIAMPTVIAPETPIGQAPMPPLASSWAKKTITVVVPQIIHEKKCGFVTSANMERI